MPVPFKRKLTKGSYGKDVEAVGRALCKARVNFLSIIVFQLLPTKVRRMYGFRKVKGVSTFQKRHRLPITGVYNQETHRKLLPYFDQYALFLYKDYSPPPQLVKPKQGFNSLHRSLWETYSMGRNLGMSDLGTYNPGSRLPSGGRSDHAVYPSKAFDLGVSPPIGYSHPVAKKYFHAIIGRPEIEYVILGNKIWTRSQGIHTYHSGGHDNHIHVSGIN